MSINAALVNEAQQLLNTARLIAEAPAAQTQIGRGHPHSQLPPGTFTGQTSTLDELGEWINAAIAQNSNAKLRKELERCREELDHLQHGSVVVPETQAEFARRVVRDYEGLTAPQVARIERGCESLSSIIKKVRYARVAAHRDARLGYKLVPETLPSSRGPS